MDFDLVATAGWAGPSMVLSGDDMARVFFFFSFFLL